jgi:predicted phosphodiesterase
MGQAMSEFDAAQKRVTDAGLAMQLEATNRDLRNTQMSLAQREAQVIELERALGIHEMTSRAPRVPGWLTKAPSAGKKHHGIWVAMLSDLHLDEVVNGPEVMGMNVYNRAIAEMRLRKVFHGIREIAFDYHSGAAIDGLILPFGGDLFAGIIHDELRRTNAAPILDTIDHWIDPVVQGIEMLVEAFGKVHIPAVVGNHGRYDRKPVAKLRARENFDWFFVKAIQRSIRDRGIKGVTFDISDSPDVLFDAYGHKIMMTHGDQAKGGSGWGGAFSPIMRLDDKKSRRQAAVRNPYDLIIIGHWHQLTFLPKGIVNGSMVGYDEYGFQNNFGFEVPKQAMWMMSPEHGVTWTAPILCQDPVAEGWKAP